MHTWLVSVLLALALMLAGCTDDNGSDDGTDDLTVEDGGAGETNETGETVGEAAGNLTAVLGSSVTEGTAPLLVTFELTTEDGEPREFIAWTLDVDGDGEVDAEGSSLPATFEHTYTETGTFEALYTLVDGDMTSNTTATITVLAGEVPEPVEYKGTILIFDPTTDVRSCKHASGTNHQVSGSTGAVKPEQGGWDYVVDHSGLRIVWMQGDQVLLDDKTGTGVIPMGADTVAVCTADTSYLPQPNPLDPYTRYVITATHPDYVEEE